MSSAMALGPAVAKATPARAAGAGAVERGSWVAEERGVAFGHIRNATPLSLPPAPRPGSVQIEAVEVHDLVPGRNEVTYERVLRIVTGVDFRNGPEL